MGLQRVRHDSATFTSFHFNLTLLIFHTCPLVVFCKSWWSQDLSVLLVMGGGSEDHQVSWPQALWLHHLLLGGPAVSSSKRGR